MKVEDISRELKDVIKFEQESFKKIEQFKKAQHNLGLTQYAKMICRNTTQREIEQKIKKYI